MTEAQLIIQSHSPHETKLWGRRLAALLEGGELLALLGDLGAGKTCFVKGLARGLNLREEQILSPTFTMIQEHRGRLPLYHIDLYRLEDVALDELGLREYLFSDAVAAVEWFERLRDAATFECLEVKISFTIAGDRTIELRGLGERYARLINRLNQRFGVLDERKR